MPTVKESALLSDSNRRYVVTDTNNNVWISNSILSTAPTSGANFTDDQYTKLYGNANGISRSALRGVIVNEASANIIVFDLDGNSSQWMVGANSQTETRFSGVYTATTTVTGGRTESAIVTFSPLAAGDTLTIAGRTLTVKAGQTLSAAEAAQAYALATLPTALVPKVTVSGLAPSSIEGYSLPTTPPAATATAVTLTSTTANSNVPDLVVTGSPKVSMVVTDGAAAARTETATVTFSSLAAAEALTIAGRTLTVKAGQTLTAAEAVQAYASATLPTALVPKVTVSGALAGYSLTAPAANATSLTLTSTTPNSNVTDLAATGTGAVKASIVVQQGIAAPRSESVVVTFNPLLSNDTLTIAGRTLTVKAGQTLTAVEAVQAFSLATLPPALVPKVTVSGATPSALTGYTLTAPAKSSIHREKRLPNHSVWF